MIKTVDSREVGCAGVILMLLSPMPLEWGDKRVEQIGTLFRVCIKSSPGFYLTLREPIDRLQMYVSLAWSTTIDGKLYAGTTDVNLARSDRLGVLERLLAQARDVIADPAGHTRHVMSDIAPTPPITNFESE